MAWNRSNENSASAYTKRTKKRMPSWVRGTIAAFVVIAGATGALLWLFFGDAKPQLEDEKPRPKAIKAVKPQISTNRVDVSKPALEARREKVTEEIVKKFDNGDYIMKNPNGKGEIFVISRESRKIPGEKPLMFTNRFERVLMQFAIPGEDIPPLPDEFTDADVEEALAQEVHFNEDDDEATVIRKEGVVELKEQFRKAKAEGMSAEEFVRQLTSRQTLEAAAVNTCRQQVMQLLMEGEQELARDLQDKYNVYLKEKGLPTLKFPKRLLGLPEDPAPTEKK